MDLLIRTSGESRLSDFLLWQSATAQIAFVPALWPEFSYLDLLGAVVDYQLGYPAMQVHPQVASLSSTQPCWQARGPTTSPSLLSLYPGLQAEGHVLHRKGVSPSLLHARHPRLSSCVATSLHCTQAARRQWNLEKAALHQVKLPLPAPVSQQLQDRSHSGTDTPPASPPSQQPSGQLEGRRNRFQPGQRAASPPAGPPQHGPAPATEAAPFSSQSAEPQQQQQVVSRQSALEPLRLSSAGQADELPPWTGLQAGSAASPAGSPRAARAAHVSQDQAGAGQGRPQAAVQDCSAPQAGQRDQQVGRSFPPAAAGSLPSQPRSEAQPEQQPAREGTGPRQSAPAAAAQAGRSPHPAMQTTSLQPGTSSRDSDFQPESLPHEQVGSQLSAGSWLEPG